VLAGILPVFALVLASAYQQHGLDLGQDQPPHQVAFLSSAGLPGSQPLHSLRNWHHENNASPVAGGSRLAARGHAQIIFRDHRAIPDFIG